MAPSLELDTDVDEAADAGANLNLLDRLEAAGEFIPVGDGTFDRLRHRNGRRRGSRLLTAGLSSQPDERQRDQRGQPGEAAKRVDADACRFSRAFQLLSRAQSHLPCTLNILIDGSGCRGTSSRRPQM